MCSDRRAFTLVEVLAAVGIFAFAVLGLMKALDASIDAARGSQREAEVRDALQNRLARMSVGSLREGSHRETVGGIQFDEEIAREEVTDAERTVLSGFWRLRVGARWEEQGSEQKWEVSHLVYQDE